MALSLFSTNSLNTEINQETFVTILKCFILNRGIQNHLGLWFREEIKYKWWQPKLKVSWNWIPSLIFLTFRTSRIVSFHYFSINNYSYIDSWRTDFSVSFFVIEKELFASFLEVPLRIFLHESLLVKVSRHIEIRFDVPKIKHHIWLYWDIWRFVNSIYLRNAFFISGSPLIILLYCSIKCTYTISTILSSSSESTSMSASVLVSPFSSSLINICTTLSHRAVTSSVSAALWSSRTKG